MQRRSFLAGSAALSLSGLTTALAAQDFPSKPITLIVSFSAGGNNDLRARQLGVPVGTALGQTVVVDNKPGASGNIGHELLSRAVPDGHTLGIGAMGPLAVNPWIFPKLGFDPKDFVPVVLIEKAPLVLVTRVDKPFRTVQDVAAAARAKPGAITIGNAGTGGAHHLCAELLEIALGTQLLGVPYKGGGPAATALLSGEIDLMFEQTYAALPSVQAGKTRALAVTSERRLQSLPGVPTLLELGYTDLVVSNWLGVIAPKGTPRAAVQRLNVAFNQALQDATLREKITAPGNLVGGGAPEEFGAFIAAESKRWSALVKAKGIRME
jgi:tripartite-type tricarboxylate transporter receptor subunit TctC